MNTPVYKPIQLLKRLSIPEQQNWLKEIAKQDNPVSYLESDYDEFLHFMCVFDWHESELGWEYWYKTTNKYVDLDNYEA